MLRIEQSPLHNITITSRKLTVCDLSLSVALSGTININESAAIIGFGLTIKRTNM
jgi:hypothetical protein